MDYIMETVGLRKAYKDNIVVDDVNMHISKGAIYGFVGPNGAGKSTVMKMILSLIQPDAGEVQLLGEKVTSHSYEIFKKVGSIIENPYFYDKMTARQNLELHCEYMGFPNKERIDEVLHLVDLQNVEKKQVCHYSLGMKQRLAIARAILAKPEFLILDEPINALDPEGIREMRTLFQRLNQEDGTTIFISSHILSEVDLLADTIGIIQHGKLLTELPIGAGKSTVMKMILSLIQPDAGEVQLLGEKVTSHSYEIFKKVGSIIENPYFYDKMTARQNLELHCEYMGFPNKERIDEVLHLVDLQNVEKKQVCHYSLGMKQRLAIARAILAKPEFLILDEPINALDPEGIREMRTLFQRLNQEDGTTIFISSHILSEVDLLADTIGIIQHGKLLTELPIEEIHKHQTDYISLQVDDVTRVAALLENMRITNFSVLDKEFIHIYDSDISGKALSKAIIENGIGLESMGRKQDTLEDFFFQLTEEEK